MPLFASPPPKPPAIADCYFYHAATLPGYGRVTGEWDLAPGIDEYLGHVSFAGKRVLDVGAATGFLTFHIERAGGSVIAYDLSPVQAWDLGPLSGIEAAQHARMRKAHIGALNNGFWLFHSANGSNARLAHGTVYAIDPALGPVDIPVFGSILLHLRDPFLALHDAARLTQEKIIVAEILPGGHFASRVVGAVMGRSMLFKPRFRRNAPWETWWNLSPALICELLGVLGFEKAAVTFHSQRLVGRRTRMFTVVATRTRPTVPLT